MQKSISLADLERYLDSLLEPKNFEEKAYNGVQIANREPISKVVTAVSVSAEVIEKAIAEKAQALVVHHGIFCKGDSHPLVGRVFKLVYQLMVHDIALLCYHLPLDAHQEIGNNWKVAKDLGLQNLEPFLEYGGQHIGVVGHIAPTPFTQFKEQVETYYNRQAALVQVHETVSKVAIVSGGAEKFITQAAEVGADCFITGRLDEPVWDHAHEYRVSFMGLGHYGTEIVGPRELAKKIQDKLQIPAMFIETKNPF